MNRSNLGSVIEGSVSIVKLYRTLEACGKSEVRFTDINLCPLGLAFSHNPNLTVVTVICMGILVFACEILCSHYGIILSFRIGRIDVEHESGGLLRIIVEIHCGKSETVSNFGVTARNLNCRLSGNTYRVNDFNLKSCTIRNGSVERCRRNVALCHTNGKRSLKLCNLND